MDKLPGTFIGFGVGNTLLLLFKAKSYIDFKSVPILNIPFWFNFISFIIILTVSSIYVKLPI